MATEYEPQEYHEHGHGGATGGNLIRRIEALPPAGKLALAAATGGVVVLGIMALRSRTASSSKTPLVAPDGSVYYLPVKSASFDQNAQPTQSPVAPAAPPIAPPWPDYTGGLLKDANPPQRPLRLMQGMTGGTSPTGVPIETGTVVPNSSTPMPAPAAPPTHSMPAYAPTYATAATSTPVARTAPTPVSSAQYPGLGGGYDDSAKAGSRAARGAWHGAQQTRWHSSGGGMGMGRFGGGGSSGPAPNGTHPPATWGHATLVSTAPGQVAPGMWRPFSIHRG